MYQYEAVTIAEAYWLARHDLLHAQVSSPRGMMTKELVQVSFEIKNPRHRLYSHPLRKFNLPFAITESLLLFAREDRVAIYEWANKNIRQFSDDGMFLYGAYGTRICDFIPHVMEKIKKDPDTRQAMLTIARAPDVIKETKNFPCTIALHFLLRNNQLQLHTYMRSNDFFWGWQYDVFMFTVLQEVVANELGVELGSYFHTTTSLHVYERHFNLLERIDIPKSVYCTAPYGLDSAKSAAQLLVDLAQGADPNRRSLEVDGVFESILRNYAAYKKGYDAHIHVPDWAREFLVYLESEGA